MHAEALTHIKAAQNRVANAIVFDGLVDTVKNYLSATESTNPLSECACVCVECGCVCVCVCVCVCEECV